jgi:5'-3' exonuclease
MNSLKEQLGAAPKRAAVIDDCCRLLEREVDDKTGLSGVAIKTAFKLVQSVKPDFVRGTLDHFLDAFLEALDPIYQEAKAGSTNLKEHVAGHSGAMADALLNITDRRAARAPAGVVKKTYERLRSTAKKHVEAAAPRVGELLEKHAS